MRWEDSGMIEIQRKRIKINGGERERINCNRQHHGEINAHATSFMLEPFNINGKKPLQCSQLFLKIGFKYSYIIICLLANI